MREFVMMMRNAGVCVVLAASMALAGCESSGSGGDPGPRPLPLGASCQSIRAELNRMDSQGAHAKVEAARTRKVDPGTQAVADRYNSLLNQYLGARCHS
jgi:hypothetical protein